MIQCIMIPRVIVDIDRDALQCRYFVGQGAEEGIVLSVIRLVLYVGV